VLIDHFGLTPRQYSLAFGVNAASFFGAAQMTGRLAARWGLVRVVQVGVTGYAAAMLLLLALNLAGVDLLWLLIGLMLVGYGFLGLVMPSTAVLSLDAHGSIAGTASALMGTLQFLTGVVVMGVVGAFADGSSRPMVAGIAGCALLAFLISWGTLGGIGQAVRRTGTA